VRVLVAHPGAELYGSDRVMLDSVIGMLDAGATVDVTVPDVGPLIEALRRTGARISVEPSLVLRRSLLRPRNWASTIATSFRAVRATLRLVHERPDLVYVNTITLPLWPVLAKLRGIPVLTHIHEAEGSASRLMLRGLYAPHLLADATVANSEFSRSVVNRAFPSLARRTIIVYNGVAGPSATTRARASLEGGPVRLVYVGRLSPRKGPDLVIAAVEELVHQGVDVEFDVLGEAFTGYEWFAADLRAAVARAGLDSKVRFLGFRDEVWSTLHDADIVVIPSRLDEPFGNTAVEAALASRPLIVSASSGLLEATQGLPGVQRVAPGDASAIADAVRAVVADWTTQREQAAEAAQLAARRFDPERYRESIVDIVASLTQVRSSRAIHQEVTPTRGAQRFFRRFHVVHPER